MSKWNQDVSAPPPSFIIHQTLPAAVFYLSVCIYIYMCVCTHVTPLTHASHAAGRSMNDSISISAPGVVPAESGPPSIRRPPSVERRTSVAQRGKLNGPPVSPAIISRYLCRLGTGRGIGAGTRGTQHLPPWPPCAPRAWPSTPVDSGRRLARAVPAARRSPHPASSCARASWA